MSFSMLGACAATWCSSFLRWTLSCLTLMPVLQASPMLPLGCRVNCLCLSLSSFCRLYFLGPGPIQRRSHLLPPTASAALCPRLLTCAVVQKSWPCASATGLNAQAKPIANSRCNIATQMIGLGPLQTQSIICWLCFFRPRAVWGRRVLIGAGHTRC